MKFALTTMFDPAELYDLMHNQVDISFGEPPHFFKGIKLEKIMSCEECGEGIDGIWISTNTRLSVFDNVPDEYFAKRLAVRGYGFYQMKLSREGVWKIERGEKVLFDIETASPEEIEIIYAELKSFLRAAKGSGM